MNGLPPAPRAGSFIWLDPGVSLAALASPQALCCRPLRGLEVGAVAPGSLHAADYAKIPPDPVATAPGTDTL
jgi:hypothetical protein